MQHLPQPLPQNHDPEALFLTARTGYDVSHQVTHLETMVGKGLQYLNIACGRLERVEQELQQFLNDYYAQVGGFFEELEKLNREIAYYDKQIRQTSRKRARRTESETEMLRSAVTRLKENLPDVPMDLRRGEMEAELKAIYRKLAKLYHPDVAADKSYSHEVLQLLNRAYAKRNLWAMREMEHSLVEHDCAGKGDSPEQKLARLRERFDSVAESATRMAERRKRLERSTAWYLKQRMEQDGFLVEVVIHRAQMQIKQAQKLLFHKKLEYKAGLI